MPMHYDIKRIFAELEQQIEKKNSEKEKLSEEDTQIDELQEDKETIESPEDAPETKEVAPATSKTTEDKHGGDEVAKEIENSPNSAKDGQEENKKESKKESEDGASQSGNQGSGQGSGQGKNSTKQSESSKDTGSKGEGSGSGNSDGDKEKKSKQTALDSDENKKSKEKNKSEKGRDSKAKEEGDYFITGNGMNPGAKRPSTTPEDYVRIAEEWYEAKKKEREEFKEKHKLEYIKKYILNIIKKIAAEHAGIDKMDGVESYDKKSMVEHMVKHQRYKLLGDKYDLRDARYVQFFIDTSGVYNCGSNRVLNNIIPEVIDILERLGYECYLAGCGNGFYDRDMVEDELYRTRKTLESYKAGKVQKIACPTAQTAAKMANDAEFSIILSDFDALTSICEMASLCQEDKVPYFLCTEDRYPWEDPEEHNWVDPNEPHDYDPKRVYDVSINGNPTLEEYEKNVGQSEYDEDEYDDEYEQEDDYDFED